MREIVTPEGLTRKFYINGVTCGKEGNSFLILRDDTSAIVGESSLGPCFAWIDAAQALPYEFLHEYNTDLSRAVFHLPDTARIYFHKE